MDVATTAAGYESTSHRIEQMLKGEPDGKLGQISKFAPWQKNNHPMIFLHCSVPGS